MQQPQISRGQIRVLGLPIVPVGTLTIDAEADDEFNLLPLSIIIS